MAIHLRASPSHQTNRHGSIHHQRLFRILADHRRPNGSFTQLATRPRAILGLVHMAAALIDPLASVLAPNPQAKKGKSCYYLRYISGCEFWYKNCEVGRETC